MTRAEPYIVIVVKREKLDINDRIIFGPEPIMAHSHYNAWTKVEPTLGKGKFYGHVKRQDHFDLHGADQYWEGFNARH